MECRHVLQPYAVCHLLRHAYFLPRAVYQREADFREHDGKRNTGETAAAAEVKHLCAGTEVDCLRYAERMQHMMLVKVVDVLA